MKTQIPQRQANFTLYEEYYFKTKAQQGDQEAFIELLHGYTNLIKYACRAVGASQYRDEDIYQQAIVEFEDLIMRHQGESGLGAYLKQFLPLRLQSYIRNHCYSVKLTSYAMSKFRVTQAPEVARWVDGLISEEFDCVSDFDSPDDYLYSMDLKELVGKAIASLPEKQRSVVTRLFFEDCKVQDIAEQDGVTPAAVYKTRKNAFERLAQYPGLSEYFNDFVVADEESEEMELEPVEVIEETVVTQGVPAKPKTYFEIALNLSKESLLSLVSSFKPVSMTSSMTSEFLEARKAIKPELSPSARNTDRLLLVGSALCMVAAIAFKPVAVFPAMGFYLALGARRFMRSYKRLSPMNRLWASIVSMLMISTIMALPSHGIEFSLLLASTESMLNTCLFNQITGLISISWVLFAAFRGYVIWEFAHNAFEWMQARKQRESGSEHIKTIAMGLAAFVVVGVIEPLVVKSCG